MIMMLMIMMLMMVVMAMIEGSLEVKLPTILR